MAVAGLVLAGLNAAALAQPAEEEGTEQPHNYFSLDQVDAYLELEAQYDYSRVKSPRRPRLPFGRGRTQKNRDQRFVEKVGLQLNGTVLDPSFMQFVGDLGLGLTQSRFKENSAFASRTDTDGDYLMDYDLRANFFAGKPLSGSVYGLHQIDHISRRFQPTLREERSGFGTSWYYAHDTFPMELLYDYRETDRTGNRRDFDDEHFTESTLHYGARWIVSEYNEFKFSFEHAENKQEYQGLHLPFDTTRDLITLEHELEFGDQRRHNLRTLLHWQEESGDFARDLFEIGPQLTLHHTDDLQTFYKYQFSSENYEGLDIETHRADWQLVHQVYTNLTTTVDVFGLYEDVAQDVNTTQYGASVDWQYNRKNRFGRLYANLALAYDTEHLRGNDGRRLILNEAHAFRDPVPVILDNRNVIPGSIVVTDPTNLRLYLPGIDYLVVQNRDVTLLLRVWTGRIANQDTVLVDYRYQTPDNGQIDTLRVDLSVEQRFDNGITPYYRLSYRNQENDLSTGFARTADRTNHHRLGVRYEADRYALGGEIEVFDDTVDPYDAFHLDGVWHIVQTPDHSVDASARFSRFFFEGGFDNRNVNMLDVEIGHRWQMGEALSTFERLTYRWEDDSVDGMTHAWDAATGFEYVVGELTAQVTLEYDRLDLPGSVEDDVGMYVRLRRDIPNVLASW